MITTISERLSARDRAVLRAVAAGRCELAAVPGGALVVDGFGLCDQFAGIRLTEAGLITALGSGPGSVRLTDSGRARLSAA